MSRLLYTFIYTRAAGAYSLPFPIPGHLSLLLLVLALVLRGYRGRRTPVDVAIGFHPPTSAKNLKSVLGFFHGWGNDVEVFRCRSGVPFRAGTGVPGNSPCSNGNLFSPLQRTCPPRNRPPSSAMPVSRPSPGLPCSSEWPRFTRRPRATDEGARTRTTSARTPTRIPISESRVPSPKSCVLALARRPRGHLSGDPF